MAIEMSSDYSFRMHEKSHHVEAEINGVRKFYTFCSSAKIDNPEEYAKSLGVIYLGSGHVIYFDGKRNEFKDLYHFFYRHEAIKSVSPIK